MEYDVSQELSKYFGKGFNEEQLSEIKEGLEMGVDISTYAKPNIPASEMNHIRKSLYAKINPQAVEVTFEEKYSREKQEEYQRQKVKSQQELGMIAIFIALVVYVLFIVFIIKTIFI